MKFTTLTLLAGVAASVSAAALTPKAAALEKFNLEVSSWDSRLNGKSITASNNKLKVSLSDSTEDEGCNGPATLFVQYQALFLYNGDYESFQQVAVDRSEDGQDQLQYFTNLHGKPQPFQIKPWSVDEYSRNLLFGDVLLGLTSFWACPDSNNEDTLSIYLDSGFGEPAGQHDCVILQLKTVPQGAPQACEYSEFNNHP
ncbi:uncharacterized protein C8A04DRAFT_29895 [Dichotomopilus funicola]|uniref:Uncharacterized protein n=1 Tax=Dichotomopilus funicola TaxID=1934379 RepID=A0AAN6ZM99_9PEZI|nr:hypothetical protein C8A04DRAFT_29895 [Dichotomopilus funicola]